MGTWQKTAYPGVRYREHPTRKHGVRRDRYLTIRYRHRGVLREEGLGWTSEGWTAERAARELGKLKAAAKLGRGPARLTEARELALEERRALDAEKAAREATSFTFRRYLEEVYLPAVEGHKAAGTVKREKGLAVHWAYPVLGNRLLSEISPFHVEKVKKSVVKAGKTPRTAQYVLAVIRQVFRHARLTGAFAGEIPTATVKLPRFDDRRQRFLTRGEAAALLAALEEKDATVAAMALVSLHGGLRAGEVLGLTWDDVDLERGALLLRDTKSGATVGVTMSDDVRALFGRLEVGEPAAPVFPNRFGRHYRQIPKAFAVTVAELGLNKGIVDRRRLVVFHTLRHTFASWLVEDGVDLYVVAGLLRHSSLSQTERYSHVGETTKARALRSTFKKRRHLEVVTAE